MHKNVYTAENAAMLLIDHQMGTIAWTHSHDGEEVKKNAVQLAKIANGVGMPLVLTSSQEENMQGMLIPELKEVAPEEYDKRIKRAGIVNAMHDPDPRHLRQRDEPDRSAAEGDTRFVLGSAT